MSVTTTTVTLSGTPMELGAQIAEQLLTNPLNFAAAQLSAVEMVEFSTALMSATAALVARNIGRDGTAMLVEVLATVVRAEASEHRGPL